MSQAQPGIVRYEDGLGLFEHVRCLPAPPLRDAVLAYAGYSRSAARPLRRREPAQGVVTVILSLGPPLRVGGTARRMDAIENFVAPLHAGVAVTEEGTDSLGLQIDLSPLGAYRLLGVSMRELDEVVVRLEDLIGPDLGRLREKLCLTPRWATRFALLDRFFLRRLDGARHPSPDVVWAWRRISETDGRLPIGALAKELGCSRRHLSARFREQIGPAPKTAARILRFQRAMRELSEDDGGRFVEVAESCGYYDQAHLNRDFRELAGTSPSAVLASRLPEGLGISA